MVRSDFWRKASGGEIVKLSNDIYYLINYLKKYGISENVLNGIQILIADQPSDIPNGSLGEVLSKNSIAIRLNILFGDDNNRRLVLYHEIFHLLYGIKNEINSSNVIKSLLEITSKISDEHRKNIQLNMLDGLNLIEEYICESLPINVMVLNTLIERPVKNEKQHNLTGNYIFKTTFNSSYGIVEDVLDKFFDKVYKGNIINDLNNYEFYSKILYCLKEEDIINVLCMLGNIYKKMMIFANDRKIISCESDIKNLERLINNIETKPTNRINIF